MGKLLLILTLMTSSAAAQIYSLPIDKARKLVQDALIKRIQDSVIHEQASQITLLTHDRDTLRINYTRLLRIKESEIRIKDEIAGHMTAINQDLYKALNQERRRGKVWKVAVPVALVAGFLIGTEL